jgi:4'-phosphopantetheinyl transferase
MDVMHKINLPGTTVAVGHHMHVQAYLDEHLTDQERDLIAPLSARKRKEWLASRELLFKISGNAQRMVCVYDDFGKPVLQGSTRHISVSHSELWCAAMISDQPCGVDIQVYRNTVQRIANRFLDPNEIRALAALDNPLHQLHLLWGAKECLYKAYGKKKLGFRENIHITDINRDAGTANGVVAYDDLHLSYEIHYRMLPEVAWVYCLQHNPV